MTVFSGVARIEGVHPLQFGYRAAQGPHPAPHGMPIVNPFVFYPWRAIEQAVTVGRWLALA